ncbi:DUF4349 domain-containing protein [Qipengyuania sp. JC766]|uniref:DUF4349 domain-containing protein n=1 Tax=Qipengyuania sp. JC766 TaxID=3232139 RepID=UPI00345A0C63
MRASLLALAVTAAALSACSGPSESTEAVTTADMAEPPPASFVNAADGGDGEAAEIPVSTPQIAYTYQYGFRVANGAIAGLQSRHVELCEAKGPTVCRIISMEQSEDEGDYGFGTLQLEVAAPQARSFGTELATVAEQQDGEQISASIAGEDLSKQIVDTEARLRARTLLRDRLMEVLRNRQGTVAELVEAERGVAQVNEEIDQATSWLAEMRGRVAFSDVTVRYSSGSPSSGGFLEPIRSVFGALGSILGTVIAVLIALIVVAVPVGLVVWAIVWGVRRIRIAASRKPGPDNPKEGETAPQP